MTNESCFLLKYKENFDKFMKEFDKLFSKCTLKVVETKDMYGTYSELLVNGPGE